MELTEITNCNSIFFLCFLSVLCGAKKTFYGFINILLTFSGPDYNRRMHFARAVGR